MRATRRAGRRLGLAVLSLTFAARDAVAEEHGTVVTGPRFAPEGVLPARAIEEPPTTERSELAGAPIIGGSTDVGVQLGLAATFTRVAPRRSPYRWKIDGLLSASLKDGPRGPEVVQQSHDVRVDVPGAVSGKVRIMPAVFFERTVNAGYFGVGNAAPAIADANGAYGSRYQFIHREVRARVNMRTPLGGPLSVMYGLSLRNVDPTAYAGSQLALDAERTDADGEPLVHGLRPANHAIVSGGLVYDTRDDEITPHSGSYDQYALRASAATPTSTRIGYGGASVVLRRYVPLGGPFVLAARGFVDLMAGRVAFYDLSQGGAFVPIDLPGGPQGIRGVPNGRYSGLVKLVANVELRATHLHFRLFGDDFRVGNNVFFDTGRVFAKYRPDPRDGAGLGLKYGVGAGVFVVWGTAAVFRLEIAYSPDAVAANPSFPIGIYAADGQMF